MKYVPWKGVFTLMEKGWRRIPLRIEGEINKIEKIAEENIEKDYKNVEFWTRFIDNTLGIKEIRL